MEGKLFFEEKDQGIRELEQMRKGGDHTQKPSGFDDIYADDVILIFDKKQHIIRCNRAAERFLHCSAKEMNGRYFQEIVYEANLTIPEYPVQRSIQHLMRSSMELHIGQRTFEFTADPIKNARGGYDGAILIVRDINKSKLSAKKLRFQAHELRERNKELNCLFRLSERFMKPEGRDTQSFLIEMVESIPRAWQYPDDTCARIVLDGSEYTSSNFAETEWKQSSDIFVHHRTVGVVEVFYLKKFPEADEGPFLRTERKLINTLAERTGGMIERERTERALEEIEKRYRLITSHLNDIVWQLDPGLRFTYVSPSIEKVLGYSPHDVLGMHVTSFVNRGGISRMEQHIRARLNGCEETKLNEYAMRHQDRRWVDMEIASSPIYGDEGELVGFAGVARDITERRQAEKALDEYSKQLEELVESRTKALKQAQKRLVRKEKLAVLGQLAGAVGHELRNPLNAIKNALYFLSMLKYNDEKEVKEVMEIMKNEIKTAERIIQSLFDYSDPKGLLIQENVNINDIIHENISLMHIDPGIDVLYHLSETLPDISCDPNQLAQVFRELSRNAVQAMAEGGQLTIWSREIGDDLVEFGVSDTGKGIPQADIERIFEPLFTTKAKGLGLGLSLSRSQVEKHNGIISVESEEGKGTTFTVRLPVNCDRR